MPADEPIWLSPERLIELNFLAVSATGEPHCILKPNELESAAARPHMFWSYGEEDVVTLAAILLLGIARNHPFEQGNKRAGFMGALEFLENNGYVFEGPDDIGPIVEDVILGNLTDDDFIEFMRDFIVEL